VETAVQAAHAPKPRAEGMESSKQPRAQGMETLVGFVLLIGVAASMILLLAGLAWQRITAGTLRIAAPRAGLNLFGFVLANARAVASGTLGPRMLIDAGLAVLLLTPYVRVLASMVYFALAEHNWKYTLFTAFVFSVLTYSLFLR
jgi:uncharacterized membrane protein